MPSPVRRREPDRINLKDCTSLHLTQLMSYPLHLLIHSFLRVRLAIIEDRVLADEIENIELPDAKNGRLNRSAVTT